MSGKAVKWTPQELSGRVVLDENGCWIWQGNIGRDGYGRASVRLAHRKYITVLAHQLAYTLFIGPPPNETLHHTCEVRECCNPYHLKPLTRADHRHEHAKSELFPCGHPRTPENDRQRKGQQCRECHKQYMKDYHQRHPKSRRKPPDLQDLFK